MGDGNVYDALSANQGHVLYEIFDYCRSETV